MKWLHACLISLLPIAPLTSFAAVIVEADWKAPGDNAAFLDTRTGLKWLDPSRTRGTDGFSYNQMITMLGPGASYEGWIYAALEEFLGLMISAKLPASNETSAYQDGLLFQSLAGGPIEYAGNSTHPDFTFQYQIINWIVGTVYDTGRRYIFRTYTSDKDGVGGGGFGQPWVPIGEDSYRFGIGHALIWAPSSDESSPIPEPTSLLIWSAIALGGLGLAYRRRKRTA